METIENGAVNTVLPDRNEKKGSVLAFIIAYLPDEDLLNRNIAAFIGHVDKLIIWDNTPENLRNELCIGDFENKIVYKSVGKNLGISRALNYALKCANEGRYDFLLTMDQDSVWYDFNLFKQSVIKQNDKELCICGPCAYANLHDRPAKKGFSVFRWQITSGMLVKTELLNRIGGYNEAFVVDCVDIELCLRAKSKGYNSYYCYDGFLLQKYGTPSKVFFWKKERNYTYYNPFRVRGIIGGHILLYKKYKHPDLPKEIRRFSKEVLKSIVYSRKQPIKLSLALFKGVLDGIFKSI